MPIVACSKRNRKVWFGYLQGWQCRSRIIWLSFAVVTNQVSRAGVELMFFFSLYNLFTIPIILTVIIPLSILYIIPCHLLISIYFIHINKEYYLPPIHPAIPSQNPSGSISIQHHTSKYSYLNGVVQACHHLLPRVCLFHQIHRRLPS